MKDLEQAYRRLDLKPGATMKEIVEARDDLLTLWDPDRLSAHPRLHAKSAGRIREINEAYHILMEGLGRSGWEGSSTVPPTSPLGPPDVNLTAEEVEEDRLSRKPAASLLDDVFSERPSKRSWQIPVWPVVISITLAVVALSYFFPFRGRNKETPETSAVTEPLPSTDLELGLAVQPPLKPEEDEAEKEATTTPEKVTQGVSETTTQVRQIRPVEAAPALSNSTRPAPTTRPPPAAPPALKRARKDTSPRGDGSKRQVPARSEQSGSRPVLVREKAPPPDESQGAAARKEPSPEEEKKLREEAERSYVSLLASSAVARTLVDGGLKGLNFVEWKVVRRNAFEIWIDLIANQSNGKAVHFIWSVNAKDQKTRPLSEAARNLERGKPATK